MVIKAAAILQFFSIALAQFSNESFPPKTISSDQISEQLASCSHQIGISY